MALLSELGSSWTNLASIVVAGVAVYLTVIALTRLAGPRSLAKMSSFDFAATVAIGSTVASTFLGSTPLVSGVLALTLLYGLQYGIATLRRRNVFAGMLDNRPLLLMDGATVIEGNLRHARVSREELWGKLRQAGVQRLDQVRAVVLETTGDMSVLTDDGPIDDVLLAGVRQSSSLSRQERPQQV